jgi:hypothetical protein
MRLSRRRRSSTPMRNRLAATAPPHEAKDFCSAAGTRPPGNALATGTSMMALRVHTDRAHIDQDDPPMRCRYRRCRRCLHSSRHPATAHGCDPRRRSTSRTGEAGPPTCPQEITMQSRRHLKLVGVCILLAGSTMADAAYAADAYNGGQIAQRWCEPCHVVVANQRGTTGEAPPFPP